MKNKLAKLLALLLAAALLTACMAGCTGKTEQPAKAEATEKAEPAKDSTPEDEEITLTFWHTYGDAEEAQFKDVVMISVFVSTLSAYGFACIRFPGRDKLFAVYLFTLMMPGFLNIIPQFLVLKQLTLPGLPNGLIGTRAGLILIYVATNVCGHTFFLRNFFRSLPSSLAESVLLDGGGHKDIFFRVMLPLSAPAVGTMTIFAFQGFWEEYFTAKVLVGANEKMITFPLLLQRLNGQYATRWEWVFAASIMALIPVIVLFVVFQRKTVVGGLTQGAVKG